MRRRLLLALALLAPTAPAAQLRTLEHEAIVPAPVEEVWKVFTTPEGYKVLGVPQSEFDLRVGGRIRSHYDPEAELGGPGTIVHHILSYEPLRMLSSRTEVPENQPMKEPLEKCWGVTRFEEVGPDRTRLHISIMGWGDTEADDRAYEFFEWGNQFVLDQLVAHFGGDAAAGADAAAMALLRSLAGGEWVGADVAEDGTGSLLRIRYETVPGGHGIAMRTWMGPEGAIAEHGRGMYWLDGAAGVRFLGINEHGTVADGVARARDGDTVESSSRMTLTTGERVRVRSTVRRLGPDRIEMKGWIAAGGPDDAPSMSAILERVREVPARFLAAGDDAEAIEGNERALDAGEQVRLHQPGGSRGLGAAAGGWPDDGWGIRRYGRRGE